MFLASHGNADSVSVQESSAIHVACALCVWLKISVCTFSNLTSLLLPHPYFQPHPQSAGKFFEGTGTPSTPCHGSAHGSVPASKGVDKVRWCALVASVCIFSLLAAALVIQHLCASCGLNLDAVCGASRWCPQGGHWFSRCPRRSTSMQA